MWHCTNIACRIIEWPEEKEVNFWHTEVDFGVLDLCWVATV
jgi:hypothetical protein